MVAVVAIPHESVKFFGQAFSLDDESNRILETLRRVWNFGRQQQNLTGADGNVHTTAILDSFQQHFAFQLIEKFRAFVIVIVGPRIRTTDDHNDEIILFKYLLVADRRF